MPHKTNSGENGARATFAEPERFIEQTVSTARTSVARSVDDAVAYTQLYPQRAIVSAFAAGFALRVLPTGRIVGGLARLSLAVLKPVALIYGVAKLWEKSRAETTADSR